MTSSKLMLMGGVGKAAADGTLCVSSGAIALHKSPLPSPHASSAVVGPPGAVWSETCIR